jgi:hypothetical protein
VKLLDKILRRTERDVALAGVMLGSVAAMSKLFPEMEKYRTLKVHFYGGDWKSWDCWREDGTDPTDAFQDFRRWYHGRPQSSCYVMRHNNGENMVKRCDIRAYDIVKGERKKQSPLDRTTKGK